MKITYTFAADCPTAELRGLTVGGGVFCAISGKYNDPIDAVKFDDEIIVAGKLRRISAMIAGKPELEQLLAVHNAAEAAKVAVLAAIGWPQYQAVQRRAGNAQGAYEAASQHGYPVKQAAAMREADEALDAVRAQYPLAAAYAMAESYSYASHDQKASAGRKAMAAIQGGADPLQSIAQMEADWSAAASKSCDNA